MSVVQKLPDGTIPGHRECPASRWRIPNAEEAAAGAGGLLRRWQVGCDPGKLVYPLLRSCTGQERDRILEAAGVFLELGSLVGTAERLHCHRNTVVNRMAAFERYTGLDLQKPRDAAVAWLAINPAAG